MTDLFKNMWSSEKRKQVEWNTEMDDQADLVMKLIMSKKLDSDKAEIFNRARVRFEAYMEAQELHVEEHLRDLKSERERLRSTVSREAIDAIHKQNNQVFENTTEKTLVEEVRDLIPRESITARSLGLATG